MKKETCKTCRIWMPISKLCKECRSEREKEEANRFEFKDDIDKAKKIADQFGITHEEVMHDRERSINKKLSIMEDMLRKKIDSNDELLKCLHDSIKAIKIMSRAYDDFDELRKIEDKWGELLVKCKFIEKKDG